MDCNNNCNNNCNDDNNDNNDNNNDYKFFLVFRNQYIRLEITKHLKRFKYLNRVYIRDDNINDDDNNMGKTIQFKSINQLINYKFIDYISIINYDINKPLNLNKNNLKLPPNIKCIEFNKNFRQKLIAGDIPLSVEKVIISDYRYDLKKDIITKNVKYLEINVFNRELEIGVLPLDGSLVQLSLPDYKHEFEVGVLPNTIEVLKFMSYNQVFEINVLPSSLKELKLEFTGYDQELVPFALPPSLTSLSIDGYKYQFKENDLPSNLTYLELKDYKNQIINLPNSVSTLSLSNSDYDFYPTQNYMDYEIYKESFPNLNKIIINGNNILK